MNKPNPSPEVKEILKTWCQLQREKYGANWKEILAEEMSKKSTPLIEALLKSRGK